MWIEPPFNGDFVIDEAARTPRTEKERQARDGKLRLNPKLSTGEETMLVLILQKEATARGLLRQLNTVLDGGVLGPDDNTKLLELVRVVCAKHNNKRAVASLSGWLAVMDRTYRTKGSGHGKSNRHGVVQNNEAARGKGPRPSKARNKDSLRTTSR